MDFNRDDEQYASEQPRRSKRGYFLSSLIGVIVGAALMAFLLPYWTGGDHGESSKSTSQRLGSEQVKTVNVNVNDAVTNMVSRVSDSVVGVLNIQKTDIWGEGGEAGSGSGVIYKKNGNTSYIVTNHHVIEGATEIEISLKDGSRVPAELIGSDRLMDLAVLKVKSDKIKSAAQFGNSDQVKVGEPVIAIGNPLGLEFAGSVTQGIISGTERAVPVDSNGDGQPDWNAEVLQTDAAINPGNSGGALMDISGKVVGINSMKIAESAVEGIGLSIPSKLVIPVIQDLEKYGEVRRPFLGIEMKSLTDIASYHWSQTLKLPKGVKTGAVIMGVDAFSPAGKAGLKKLDVITGFDGHKVNDVVDLRERLYRKKIGDRVNITFYRSGKKKTAEVKLTEADRLQK
ncbi:S1C family serine protease [Bacillus velezensis]|uniref:S1C family serine protease n=1 Tax=Bacillus velezensis TaxID=492670 RepID=UPI002E22A3AE|nr:S1C family serine protease [Bacillus velezensis]MED3673438.1 S1C family serine protease [Bacillus velezensis]